MESGVVSVSDATEKGNNFEKLSSGTGPTWDFNKDFRTLLSIEPLTLRLNNLVQHHLHIISLYPEMVTALEEIWQSTMYFQIQIHTSLAKHLP